MFHQPVGWPEETVASYSLQPNVNYLDSDSELHWQHLRDAISRVSASKKFGLDVDALQSAKNLMLESVHGSEDTCGF